MTWYARIVGRWLDEDVTETDPQTGEEYTAHVEEYNGGRVPLLRQRYGDTLLRIEDDCDQPVENVITDPNVTMNRIWVDDGTLAAIQADADFEVIYAVEVPDGQTRG